MDLDSLPPGLYETLVTSSVERAVAELGELATVAALADAEAPLRLSDHIRRIAERVLSGTGYAGHPQAQAELVNRLVDVLRTELGPVDEDVVYPPRLLQAVLNRSAAGLGTLAARDRRWRGRILPLLHHGHRLSLLAQAAGDRWGQRLQGRGLFHRPLAS